MRAIIGATQVFVGLLVGISAQAQDTMSGAQMFKNVYDIDVDTAEIAIQAIAPGLYVALGAGGNIAISIGEQGVLVVDDQFPATVPKLLAAIDDLGGGEIDFVINTHWHFDHTDGNPLLAKGGSWIVSHLNSRQMMTQSQLINTVYAMVEQPPSPVEGLPVITYTDRMNFHFNGEQIDLIHIGPAHTNGDAAVMFRGRNVVHMGDVFNTSGYPFIDTDNGGDIDGVIRYCEAILKEIDEQTIVIPGHGPVATYADLVNYVVMLKSVRMRVAAMIVKGATLDEIIAAGPTEEWDAVNGDPTRLLDRTYASLTRMQ